MSFQSSSILVLYDGDRVETRRFQGRLRGLAWDSKGTSLTLVGNRGRVVKIVEEAGYVELDTGIPDNLRSASISPIDDSALIVGNAGTVLTTNSQGSLHKISSPTLENLRAVRWNPDGTMALIAGNNGALLKFTGQSLDLVDYSRANLRGISWRKGTAEALVTSNCFGQGFIPSSNLFLFDGRTNSLKPVSEGRSDLIGVDWNPKGSFAVAVGYDVVWHTGFIGRFDGSALSKVEFQNSHVYPVAVSWDPTGSAAAIATSIPQLNAGQGRIILWNGETFEEIYRNEEFFFSNITWSPVGFRLASIASTEARTYDV